MGEHCKLPQRGPGQSPGRKRIWCTLELREATGSNHVEYSEVQVQACIITWSEKLD